MVDELRVDVGADIQRAIAELKRLERQVEATAKKVEQASSRVNRAGKGRAASRGVAGGGGGEQALSSLAARQSDLATAERQMRNAAKDLAALQRVAGTSEDDIRQLLGATLYEGPTSRSSTKKRADAARKRLAAAQEGQRADKDLARQEQAAAQAETRRAQADLAAAESRQRSSRRKAATPEQQAALRQLGIPAGQQVSGRRGGVPIGIADEDLGDFLAKQIRSGRATDIGGGLYKVGPDYLRSSGAEARRVDSSLEFLKAQEQYGLYRSRDLDAQKPPIAAQEQGRLEDKARELDAARTKRLDAEIQTEGKRQEAANRVNRQVDVARTKQSKLDSAAAFVNANEQSLLRVSAGVLYDPSSGTYVQKAGLSQAGDQQYRRVTKDQAGSFRELEELRARREAAAALRGNRGLPPAFTPPGGGGNGPRGPLSAFGDSFGGGKFSAGIANYARYTAVSSLIFGGLALGAKAVAEIKDYRDSLTDMEQALGGAGTASQGFINDLQEIARLAGENVGAAMDAAARGVRAFGEELDTLSEKQRVGTQVALAAQQLSVVANKSLTDATGDTIAIGSAFGLGPESLTRVVDAIAVAKQQFGADPAQIAQGLANGAVALQEAGFDLAESAQVVALVQSRTDQSGQAAATRLARIVSRFGTSGAINSIEQLNKALPEDQRIDAGGSVRDQVLQIGQVYGSLSGEQQRSLASSLAGSSNLRELIPLLKESEALVAAMGAAADGAGAGLVEFNRKNNDLAGTMRKISGDFSNLIVNLSDASFTESFTLALKLVERTLAAANGLLGVYNSLPSVLKESVSLLLTFAAVQRSLAAGGILSRALGAGGRTAGRAGNFARGVTGELGFGAAGRAGFDGAALRDRGRSVVGSRAFKVTAGLLALDEALNVLDRIGTIGGLSQKASRGITAVNGGSGASSTDFAEAAANLRSTAAELRNSTGGLTGLLVNILTGGRTGRQAAQADLDADSLDQFAGRLAAAMEAAAAKGIGDAFDVSTPEGIQAGLELLSGQGKGAETQIAALRDKFRSVRARSERFSGLTIPDEGGAAAVAQAVGNVDLSDAEVLALSRGIINTALNNLDPTEFTETWDKVVSATIRDGSSAIMAASTPAIEAALKSGDIEGAVAAAVEGIVGGAVLNTSNGPVPLSPDEISATIREKIDGSVGDELREFFSTITSIATAEYVNALTALIPEAARNAGVSAALSGGNQSLTAAKELLKGLQDTAASVADPEAQENLQGRIREAKLGVQQAIIGDLESQLSLLKTTFSPDDPLASLDAEIASVKQRLAVNTEESAERALQGQLNQLSQQRRRAILAQSRSADLAGIDPRNSRAVRDAQLRDIQRNLQLLESEGVGDDTVAVLDLIARRKQLLLEQAAEDLQVASLRRQQRTGPRDSVGQARNKLIDIDAELAAGAFGPQREQLLLERQGALAALQDLAIDERLAASLAALPAADAAGEAAANLQAASARLALFREGTLEHNKALREFNLAMAAVDELAVDEQLVASLAALPTGDASGEAAAHLQAASARLALFKEGTLEYNRALIDFKAAQQAVVEAALALDALRGDLLIDLTDPVAVASKALRDAIAAAANDSGLGEDRQIANDIAVKQAASSLFVAKQSEFLRQLSYEKSVGDITAAEYLRALEARLSHLKAIDDGSYAAQLAIQETTLAIKSAQEELTGLFNLGDIAVPTPYEVRRAVKAGLSSVALGGDGAFAPTSLAAASAGTTVINHIQIDGADFAKVVSHLDNALGVRATSRVSASSFVQGRKF